MGDAQQVGLHSAAVARPLDTVLIGVDASASLAAIERLTEQMHLAGVRYVVLHGITAIGVVQAEDDRNDELIAARAQLDECRRTAQERVDDVVLEVARQRAGLGRLVLRWLEQLEVGPPADLSGLLQAMHRVAKDLTGG